MTSESDEAFIKRMAFYDYTSQYWEDDVDRLFALARRGAEMTLDRQRLVAYPDGSEWVEEIYSRFVPLPPPPKGDEE